MIYTIVGLGNPGREYENTRHNVGVMALTSIFKAFEAKEWNEEKKKSAKTAVASIGKGKAVLVEPLVFMNSSGKAVLPFIKTAKDRERLVLIHDDLDLPLGKVKLSYGRSSGGHKGVDSVMRMLKSKNFLRVRIGVSSATYGGKLKKPTGEKDVIDFILGKFKPSELETLKKEFKKIAEAVQVFVDSGREKMVSTFRG